MAERPQSVIIGLGSGRCGTHSLAALLALQPDTTSMHQPAPCLPWHVDYGWYASVPPLVRAQPTGVVALVAWYYLPYAELLLRDLDVRFVCLQRDRTATVASIERLTVEFDNWSNRPVEESASARFRPLFPQFDVATKREALERYWDLYYQRAGELCAAYPDRARIYPTDGFNDPEVVDDLLTFAGYGDDRVVETGIREGLMDPYVWRGGPDVPR